MLAVEGSKFEKTELFSNFETWKIFLEFRNLEKIVRPKFFTTESVIVSLLLTFVIEAINVMIFQKF